MERERIWSEWVVAQSPVKSSEQDAVLRRIADFWDTAPPETVIPLMTRCRPLPQIVRVVRAYQRDGIGAEEVTAFFSNAPQDVRVAFDTLRREAV